MIFSFLYFFSYFIATFMLPARQKAPGISNNIPCQELHHAGVNPPARINIHAAVIKKQILKVCILFLLTEMNL